MTWLSLSCAQSLSPECSLWLCSCAPCKHRDISQGWQLGPATMRAAAHLTGQLTGEHVFWEKQDIRHDIHFVLAIEQLPRQHRLSKLENTSTDFSGLTKIQENQDTLLFDCEPSVLSRMAS